MDPHRIKSSEELFDFDGYIKWQDERAVKMGSSNAFIREFVTTQTFNAFIEHSFRGLTISKVRESLDSPDLLKQQNDIILAALNDCQPKDETDETNEESYAVFFESCIELLTEGDTKMSLKRLKAA